MGTITTTIQPFTRTPSRQSPATFSEDMDIRLSEENSRIEQMNSFGEEANSLRDDVNQMWNYVSEMHSETKEARDEAVSAKNDAVSAANEIKSYVIPEEATYSSDTIEQKIRRAKILKMIGA